MHCGDMLIIGIAGDMEQQDERGGPQPDGAGA